ncbi:MAG: DUF4336 domain-containing protein [Okeania sp. SIO2G4]|uniref:DUF4336 domain-containing protein n=1 Tax=unclassified Okeania TaxID=2634635 RepID=UPI0013BD8D57|nr:MULTISPECIES: DUF4336 domain-containing protein [unclassified Okeania]NEP05693.1 DUF4336 domain-containing protein [Okeania sp. SIO4D6]NEP39556.1 DUF4336 domain-containing protein [Okeania sp. SIO2H7]NEP70387.1 DUF4336 domain-containing protein [Okeania sp. SIO2G5]NEP91621.1 DUF4336 domain-containing protein [Okeania sp. SIO2F5]NEQ92814.1 DUF4336 domain-containing protein [Okeania sp. SIO2G4]
MSQNIIDLYEPINIPKIVDENIWIVDGGIVTMAMYGTRIPFPTRMTIVRLKNGELWCHSPIELTPKLKAEIDKLGLVRHLISPNKIHYTYIHNWAKAYPEATAWASPGVLERAAQQKIEVTFHTFLADEAPVEWSEEIAQLIFRGSRFMDEVVFFHRQSSTLILTDLIENFELNKVSKKFGFLIKLIGCAAPNGKTPLDLRVTFWGRKNQARDCFKQMLKWEPQKIILSHGKWYEKNGTAELNRAFAWLGQG